MFARCATAPRATLLLLLLSAPRHTAANASAGASSSDVEMYEDGNNLFIETIDRQGDVLVNGESLAKLFATVRTLQSMVVGDAKLLVDARARVCGGPVCTRVRSCALRVVCHAKLEIQETVPKECIHA